MKLSMWLINHYLKDVFPTIPVINSDPMLRCIESVRLFTFDSLRDFSTEFVYIGKQSDFFRTEQDQTLLASGDDLIFVDCADITEVFNEVIKIFDHLRALDQALRAAALQSDPFQAILNVIHGELLCPMLFGQKDLHIFAITGQYPEEEVYPGWAEICRLRTIPLEFLNDTPVPDMSQYPETIPTVAIPVGHGENKKCAYQIRSNCYCKGEMWGHLYIYYPSKALDPGVLQLARFFADVYGELLDRIMGRTVSRYAAYTFLVDLIDGKAASAEALNTICWKQGWDKDQKLCLCRIRPTGSSDNSLFLDFACGLLSRKAKNEIVFPYRQNIVVIAPWTESYDEPELLRYATASISRVSFRCGVSYPFVGLERIAVAYFQAEYADIRGKADEGRLFFFDSFAFAGLIEYVRDQIDWKPFISPSLYKLYEMDCRSGTEYYKTLFWLLVNDMHIADAARQLYVHRNTLKYRLNRITELIPDDLTDPNTIQYLHFCYALMLEDYPPEGRRREQREQENA